MVNTKLETRGQTPTSKTCPTCGETKSAVYFGNAPSRKDGLGSHCRDCRHNENVNKRMWVNGKYISRHHPLFKPGRYRNFEEAAFESLTNYKINPEGDVYITVNPAWPEWVKVGMAVDAEDRLNNYQTSSPFRDYMLYYKCDVKDRRIAEAEAHKALDKCFERQGEWFKCSPEEAKATIDGLMENFQ